MTTVKISWKIVTNECEEHNIIINLSNTDRDFVVPLMRFTSGEERKKFLKFINSLGKVYSRYMMVSLYGGSTIFEYDPQLNVVNIYVVDINQKTRRFTYFYKNGETKVLYINILKLCTQ
jgi:hypothetical protein